MSNLTALQASCAYFLPVTDLSSIYGFGVAFINKLSKLNINYLLKKIAYLSQLIDNDRPKDIVGQTRLSFHSKEEGPSPFKSM